MTEGRYTGPSPREAPAALELLRSIDGRVGVIVARMAILERAAKTMASAQEQNTREHLSLERQLAGVRSQLAELANLIEPGAAGDVANRVKRLERLQAETDSDGTMRPPPSSAPIPLVPKPSKIEWTR